MKPLDLMYFLIILIRLTFYFPALALTLANLSSFSAINLSISLGSLGFSTGGSGSSSTGSFCSSGYAPFSS
jgi:hypothetical protein